MRPVLNAAIKNSK